MHEVYTESVLERFWAKVDKNGPGGCWLWTAARRLDGYGVIFVGGHLKAAHRISYELHHRSIPEGLYVLHRCRNRHCVNPDHLEAGTQSKNIGPDRERDGTVNRGERNGRAKLTEAHVRTIRRRYLGGGVTQRTLAREFKVSHSHICLIVRRKKWKHIGGSDEEDQ